jgi:hypothetical protein
VTWAEGHAGVADERPRTGVNETKTETTRQTREDSLDGEHHRRLRKKGSAGNRERRSQLILLTQMLTTDVVTQERLNSVAGI